MITKQITIPQQLVMSAYINSAGIAKIGFVLIDESMPKPKDCMFPIVTVQEVGIDNLKSARLVWKNNINNLEFTDTLANSNETVYNILKSQCSTKNLFQLYVTLTQNNVDTEFFIAQGAVYIYQE